MRPPTRRCSRRSTRSRTAAGGPLGSRNAAAAAAGAAHAAASAWHALGTRETERYKPLEG